MDQNLEDKIMSQFPWFEAKTIWGENLGCGMGCDCDDGWYNLIHDFCKELDDFYKTKNKNINKIKIYQIKEKYGTLRIYLGNYIDGVDDIVAKYEDLSGEICEMCGNIGDISISGSWYKTLCEKHREELRYKNVDKSIK